MDGPGYCGAAHVILRDLTTGTTFTREWPLHQTMAVPIYQSHRIPDRSPITSTDTNWIFSCANKWLKYGERSGPSTTSIRRLLANVDDLGTSGNTSGHSGFEDLVDNGGMATLVSPNGTQMEALFIFNDPGQEPDIAYQISNVPGGIAIPCLWPIPVLPSARTAIALARSISTYPPGTDLENCLRSIREVLPISSL